MARSTTSGQTRFDQQTLERARAAVPLASLIGKRVKLRRSGRDWTGLCPFHDEKTPSFDVVESKGFYHCHGCGAHGDAIRWLQEHEGLEFRAAVESLLGGAIPDARRTAHPVRRERAERPVDVVPSATAGAWIWRTAGPARGEIVERYLASRELDPFLDCSFGSAPHTNPADPNESWCPIDRIRYHPRCPLGVWKVGADPAAAWRTAPAMVVPIADAAGAVWGVRVTWLKPDGSGEADLPRRGDGSERPKRKIFGRVQGLAAFLTPPDTGTGSAGLVCGAEPVPLIIGEGFETAWAFAQQFGGPCRVAAALSLENLQGGAVKLRDGSLPLWNVQSDPDRPPFVVDEPGAVIVLVDADMKPLRAQKVQRARGDKPVKADLNGLERAEICATLAAQAWRRAGATSVRVMRPRMGSDFNDVVRADHPGDGGQNDMIRSEAA